MKETENDDSSKGMMLQMTGVISAVGMVKKISVHLGPRINLFSILTVNFLKK